MYAVAAVLHYAFIASRAQTYDLQTQLLRPAGIMSPGSTFVAALDVFNEVTGSAMPCDPSEIAAPKLMKKLADIYFTKVAAS